MKSQKPHLADCNLLIVQDLWSSHNPILLIILLKEFKKINVNINRKIKKCESCGFKCKDCDCSLEYTTLIRI